MVVLGRPNRAFATGASSAVRNLAKVFAQSAAKSVATQAGKAVAKTMTKTTQTRSKRKRNGQTSLSSGFFNKKAKTNIFRKYTKNGMITTQECGVVCTGTQPSVPVYVGHATHGNTLLMRRVFWRAIVRDLFTKHGIQIIDIETLSPGTSSVLLEYQIQSPNSAPITYTLATAGLSYNQIASNLYTTVNNAINASGAQANQYFYLNEIRLEAGSLIQAELDLRDVSMSFLCKSDLKIQNRTIALGADDDANSTENVANQPLYGKFYSGRGNGVVMKLDQAGVTQKALLCSDSTGVFAKAPGTSEFWLKEPPLPTFFVGKPKYGKVSIEPGYIKTSSLTHTVRIKQIDFWKSLVLGAPTGAASSGAIQRLGKYYLLALEKTICATAADTSPVLGMEINQRMGCMIHYKRIQDSAEVFEDQTFTTV